MGLFTYLVSNFSGKVNLVQNLLKKKQRRNLKLSLSNKVKNSFFISVNTDKIIAL